MLDFDKVRGRSAQVNASVTLIYHLGMQLLRHAMSGLLDFANNLA